MIDLNIFLYIDPHMGGHMWPRAIRGVANTNWMRCNHTRIEFEMPVGPLWTFMISNKDICGGAICGGARCKGTYPNNIAKAINRDCHFPNMVCIFWIEQHIGQCGIFKEQQTDRTQTATPCFRIVTHNGQSN